MPFLKLIGAFIGLSTFGFAGAILGWIGGWAVGVLLTDGPKGFAPGARAALQQERQAVFIETLFRLMGSLAKADDHVSKSEIDHIERFMTELGMTAAHRKQAIGFFQQGVKSDFQLQPTLARLREVCGRSLQMKHLLLTYLVGVALADGELHPNETQLMAQVAEGLGYSQRAFEQLMAMIQGQNRFGSGYQSGQQQSGPAPRKATNTLVEAYQALGVSAQDSDKDVKRAYRKLISQYHPDKLIGQGVPEDMIKKATERSKEIHAAYELIEKHRKGA